jgi:T5SS/PEP-CTERM-associated repeat protein
MTSRSAFHLNDGSHTRTTYVSQNPIFLAFALWAVAGFNSLPSFGAITISGDTVVGVQVMVGINSFGTLRIDSGSNLTTQSSSSIGSQTFGNGIATVTDPGSQWSLMSGLEVGSNGVGRLEILNGGVVNLSQAGTIRIATSPTSHGTVVVDGPGSVLNSTTNLLLGNSPSSGGSPLLRISNGAIVNSASGPIQISPQGRVELDNGLLRISQLTNNGAIVGSGELSILATSGSGNAGRIEAEADDFLRITSPGVNFTNQGIIAVDGGEIEVTRQIVNQTFGQNPPEITLRNGVLRAGTAVTNGPQLTNSALLAATGGLNDLYGRVENIGVGEIAVTNQSVLVFHDDVSANSGTIVVFPGSSAVFLEDLTMSGSSVLLADLAGTSADTGFGQIEVVGSAQLNASLNVSLDDGFTPQAGDSFALVAAGGLSGSLALGNVADLPPGLMWDLGGDEHHVVLSVVPGLAGDYNGDGVVDGGDYVVWRRTLGQTGPDLAADGNDNGVVDAGDFAFWRSRYGDTLAPGSGTAASVPEPMATISFLLGLTIVLGRRWMLR